MILRVSGVRVVVEGQERVDWKGPVVIVVNHQSWFDVFALVAFLPGRGTFVGKEELGRIPIFGSAWKACGHISLNRSDRKKAIESLDRAGERIRRENRAVILFPEGTRSVDGRLQEFKKGAFILALKTGVPIVPIGISGSRQVMPKGSFFVRPGEIRVRVGDPIPIGRMSLGDRDSLLERSRMAVAELMEDGDAGERAREASK
jgi:1-acyl-sn-glycerol-3-phosphate acyltransferase